MNNRIFLSLRVLLLSLPLIGCGPNMKASLAGYPLQAPASENLSKAIVVDASDIEFSHWKAGNPAIPGNTFHDMADINQRYAKQLGDVLFSNTDGSPVGERAVLALESVEMVQIVGEGFASFDIEEQVTARWTLYNADKSQSLFSLEATGSASAPSGWGSGIAENAKDRMGRAYQDLLQTSIQSFGRSEDLARFVMIPEIYLGLEGSRSNAQAMIAGSPAKDHPKLLEAMRHVSVKSGMPELYDFSSERIYELNIESLADESSLLHDVIASPAFSDTRVNRVLGRSSSLDTVNDEGMTPLESALAYGRDDVAVALVAAGADPIVNYAGNAYVSAEIAYRLVGLIDQASGPVEEVASEAIRQYRFAIEDANYAIEQNDAAIFAGQVMKVLGPVVQYSAAYAEANYEARQAAKTSPVGIGFGYAEFELQEYDTKTPAEAILDLRELIGTCENRIAELEAHL